MLITNGKEAWRKAEVCLVRAETTDDARLKRGWIELGESWSVLAQSIESRSEPRYIPPEDL